MKPIEEKVSKILISEAEIQGIVAKLGQQITLYYQNSTQPLIVVGLLRGSFVFMADLVRQIQLPVITDFMTVSSYGDSTESSGNIKIIMDLDESIQGRDILLVEDIIDTGRTLSKVVELLKSRQPSSMKICTLLNKPSRREIDIQVDFSGIEIPDEFVVGYGLDYAQEYRNLPYVGVLG